MKLFFTRLKRILVSKRFWAEVTSKVVLGLLILLIKFVFLKTS